MLYPNELCLAAASNLAGLWEFPVRAMGLRWKRWTRLGVSVADASSVSPLLNNATLLREVGATELITIATRVTEYFSMAPGGPITIHSYWPSADFSFVGASFFRRLPVMVRAAGGVPPPPPVNLVIQEVTDAASLEAFEVALVEGFPVASLQPYRAGTLFDRRVLGSRTFRMWVGWADGQPVASATAYISSGLVGVSNIATLEHMRGRGFGTAMAWRATLASPDLPAVLSATQSGCRLYQRMGYQKIASLTTWRMARQTPPSAGAVGREGS